MILVYVAPIILAILIIVLI